MRTKLLLIALSAGFIFIASCNKRIDYNQKDNGKIAGIVFCIDDYYVGDFYKANHYRYIQSMGIKMTYFITKYHILSKGQKRIIKIFQADGHEIGYHGTHHIHAKDFLDTSTITKYLNYEINPDLKLMRNDGLLISDFSYPYGSHTPQLDSVLLNKYFYFIKLGSTKPYFYTLNMPREIIHPIPLDERYWIKYHISLQNILNYIDSAARQNKIIMFYGHRLTDNYRTNVNAIWFDKFRLIMDYSKEKGMKFYTLNDLKKLDNKKNIILNYKNDTADIEE